MERTSNASRPAAPASQGRPALVRGRPAISRPRIDIDAITRVYGAYAPLYDVTFGRLIVRYQKRLLARCRFEPGQRVLEIGVGTGLSLQHYPREVEVLGLDAVPAMLEKAQRCVVKHGLTNVSLRACNAECSGLPSASFDFVMMMFVLSVTPNPAALLREALRLCKPGGSVYVLNHFSGGRGFGPLEKAFARLARWIGFRSDMPLSVVTDLVKPESVEALPPLGFFRLVHVHSQGREQGAAPPQTLT